MKSEGKHPEFQKKVRAQIAKQMPSFNFENRIRHKIARWKFADPPAYATNRCMKLFGILEQKASPAISAGYLRALFNGWSTIARMWHQSLRIGLN